MGKRFMIGLLLFCVLIAFSLIQDPAKQVKQLIRFHYYTSVIEGSERYLYFGKDYYKSGIVSHQQFHVKDQGSYMIKRKCHQIYLILRKGGKMTSFLVNMKHNQCPEHFTSLHSHVRYVLKY
jgi:hypothetical protein